MSLSPNKTPIIAVVGATAVGKTELSINIALKFLGEIISADSMQIYKEFNISTAKPNETQLKTVKHYLINEVSVKTNFSVYEYIKRARVYAKKIYDDGKIPILVGGTGLYVDSFLNGLNFEGEKTIHNIKKEIQNISHADKEKLYNDLLSIDPISAEKIHHNDIKRVVRALDFYYSCGYPISKQVEKSKLIQSPYTVQFIGLNFRDRSVLYDRINKRVDDMIKRGLVDEVKYIMSLPPGDTAKYAIGYKEIIPYIKGLCSIDEAVYNLKRNTRRYAKRQLTWFNKNKNIKWIYIDDYNSFDDVKIRAENIIEEWGLNEII